MKKHKKTVQNEKNEKKLATIRLRDLPHEALFVVPSAPGPLKLYMVWNPFGDMKGDECGVYRVQFWRDAISQGLSFKRGARQVDDFTPHRVVRPIKL